MKEKLLNNLGWKLLSLCLAAVAWIVIVNVDDPVKTKIISDVPVEIINESSIQEKDKVYDIVEGSTVSVYLKGKRKMVDSVTAADISAVADLSALSSWNAVPVIVSCPKYKDLEVSLTGKVQTLKINLEDKVTEQYQVVVATTGEVEEGYYLGNPEARPNLIKVSGGKSSVARIAEVRVVLNVTDASERLEAKLEPKAYDKEGEEINPDMLTFSSSQIKVTADILPTKQVPIKVKTKGETAYGYYVDSVEYEPKEVLLAGNFTALSEVDGIPIEIDLGKTSVDKEISVSLGDLLPEGVKVADEKDMVSIKIVVEKMIEKEYRIAVDQIDIRNLPEPYKCEFNLMNHYINVRVMGEKEKLDQLTEQDFLPYLDLSGCKKGNYTKEIEFGEMPEGITLLSAPTISLTLKEEEEVPAETESPEPSVTPEPEVTNLPEETSPPAEEPVPESTEEPKPEEGPEAEDALSEGEES